MKEIQRIVDNIGRAFGADERETSILWDYVEKRVLLETTEPFTARRWFKQFKDTEGATFDHRADSLKLSVPMDYVRKPESIIKLTFRK